MKNIFATLLLLLTILSIISLITQGNFWLPIMVILGATVGVIMGLVYPFSLLLKIGIITGLCFSMVSVVFGFKNHSKTFGQVMTILSVIIWVSIGIVGLGTGS